MPQELGAFVAATGLILPNLVDMRRVVCTSFAVQRVVYNILLFAKVSPAHKKLVGIFIKDSDPVDYTVTKNTK